MASVIEENRHPRLPPLRYHEFAPASTLRPFVQCYAEFAVGEGPAEPFTHLIMPDGCSHLSYLRDSESAQPRVTLSAPRFHAIELEMCAGQLCWDVKFRPAGLEPLLGVTELEGFGQLMPTAGHLGGLGRRIGARLDDCSAAVEAKAVLDEELAGALPSATPPDGLIQQAIDRIVDSNGTVAIALLANELNISERQLQRRFQRAVGLTPKQFARIRRFRTCVPHMIRENREAWGIIAIRHGYADQAHLTREFSELSGRPPTELEDYIRRIEHGHVNP